MAARPALAPVLVLALALGPVISVPAFAQRQPTLPGQPGVPAVTCGPSNNSPACQSLRQAVPGGSIPGVVAPRLAEPPAFRWPQPEPLGDMAPQRLIPPRIQAFLRDPRIDPLTRAYLLSLGGRKRERWSVQDLQTLSALIPTLTELMVPTALISELYEFLGLDPASLFEPQLGEGWQAASTAQDPRRRFRRAERCLRLTEQAQADPSQVLVEDLLNCDAD
ncbi:hypothetical protein E0493_17250 [Roseomonas sp. M0104]|uniref:Uncharacterized protein n=1 Tax=Teichococcus coralli TaxID=2545983 RepID=A0A845BG72_9PROT|nr:hypothetical protein [Pseudoroseomonas coralli]MXP65096.1 hypothetical protein [Pseudoroseomonas coralli]